MQRICKYLSLAYSIGRFLRLKVSKPMIALFSDPVLLHATTFVLKYGRSQKKTCLPVRFVAAFFFHTDQPKWNPQSYLPLEVTSFCLYY